MIFHKLGTSQLRREYAGNKTKRNQNLWVPQDGQDSGIDQKIIMTFLYFMVKGS